MTDAKDLEARSGRRWLRHEMMLGLVGVEDGHTRPDLVFTARTTRLFIIWRRAVVRCSVSAYGPKRT
jgi:hypothetical protein